MEKKRVILKFGGASLKDFIHIKKAANLIKRKIKQDIEVIAVVSAMGKMTDELLSMAKEITENPPKREQDMLVSVGERISMALLAMALYAEGIEAISLTGSQAGIITTSVHSDAEVINVVPKRILTPLEEGMVVIVAGFQGMSLDREITTLGRGGSDTTAVALAVALGADRVEFYKDVGGVFEEDPKGAPSAKHLPQLTYQDALAIISRGEKKIIHPRAVMLAQKNSIPLHVLSFDERDISTVIQEETKIFDIKNRYEVLV